MADVKISALSSAVPLTTSLFVSVVNSTTVKVNGQDIVDLIEANATLPTGAVVSSGSMFYGAAGKTISSLAIGAAGYQLESTNSLPAWKSPVKYVTAQVIASTVTLTTGDDKARIHIPPAVNGYNLTYVHALVNATSADSTTLSIMVHNLTDAADMLTSAIEIDGGEIGSNTAASAAVIDTAKDDVATNDIIRFDLDAVGSTAPKGMVVTLGFSLP